jgi:hypothetical protein
MHYFAHGKVHDYYVHLRRSKPDGEDVQKLKFYYVWSCRVHPPQGFNINTRLQKESVWDIEVKNLRIPVTIMGYPWMPPPIMVAGSVI